MEIKKNVAPPEKAPQVSEEYLEMFELNPRDPETKKGDAAIFPIEKYRNLVSSLLPRWNRQFAPKHWVQFRDWKDGKRVVVVQRTA